MGIFSFIIFYTLFLHTVYCCDDYCTNSAPEATIGTLLIYNNFFLSTQFSNTIYHLQQLSTVITVSCTVQVIGNYLLQYTSYHRGNVLSLPSRRRESLAKDPCP